MRAKVGPTLWHPTPAQVEEARALSQAGGATVTAVARLWGVGLRHLYALGSARRQAMGGELNPTRHTDGTLWVACTAETPLPDRTVATREGQARVYHADAKVDRSSPDGGDDYYRCPHCGKGWWVEYDG